MIVRVKTLGHRELEEAWCGRGFQSRGGYRPGGRGSVTHIVSMEMFRIDQHFLARCQNCVKITLYAVGDETRCLSNCLPKAVVLE